MQTYILLGSCALFLSLIANVILWRSASLKRIAGETLHTMYTGEFARRESEVRFRELFISDDEVRNMLREYAQRVEEARESEQEARKSRDENRINAAIGYRKLMNEAFRQHVDAANGVGYEFSLLHEDHLPSAQSA